MTTVTLLILLAGCSSVASPPGDGTAAPLQTEPEGAVRFSFAINGLEHGNGAL